MPLINNHVLMSGANNFSTEQPINPYYHHTPLDLAVAIIEHTTIYKLLIQAGIKVTKIDSPSGSQDGVYTANWALVRGDKAVLARLPSARKAEEDYAEKVLTELGKTVIRVPDNLRFSGQGDALACGDPQMARVELTDHMLDRVDNFIGCGLGRDTGAVFPRSIQDILQLLGHEMAFISWGFRFWI